MSRISYGKSASEDSYLMAKTAQFYARRFVILYPNEELPAGRAFIGSQFSF